MDHHKKEEPNTTRRAALKALAAATGAVALSALPQKWEKPQVEVGALPAFAQASVPTVSNISSNFTGVNDCNGGTGSTQVISFDYDDPTGNVTNATIIHDVATFLPSGLVDNITDPITASNVTWVGDQFSGTITLAYCVRFNTDTSLQDAIFITNAAGQNSNTLTITTAKPPGALVSETKGPGVRTPLP